MPLLLPVHITAGGLAIILGAVALLSSKGATLHRRSGALFIAAGSLFSIRARVARILPEPLTTGAMRALPVVLIFVAMFYWLWRVHGRRTFAPARSVQRLDLSDQEG
ncbi:MAG TPA: hypothetical protein VKE51_39660 [Vicinamibacterales bacterium]|nr:hypothetical protein [Vicinamibacterales bacterium]